MIVAAASRQLGVIVAEALADRGRFPKIEGEFATGANCLWESARVHRQIRARVDREAMAQHVAGSS